MNAYLDATVLIALGTVGELDRLAVLAAEPMVLPAVRAEVTTEPAMTALERALETELLSLAPDPSDDQRRRAATILDAPEESADAHLLAAVLDDIESERPVGVVSDDRRVRTVTRGLGATVTGTIGVIVRTVEAGRNPETANELVRRLDRHGLHMTASLRTRATELIDEAAE